MVREHIINFQKSITSCDKRSLFLAFLVFLTFLTIPGPSIAQPKDENLLQDLPKGYRFNLKNRRDNVGMMVMLPQNENSNNWTEVLITKVFFGLKEAELKSYKSFSSKNFLTTCNNGDVKTISSGEENGYPVLLWTHTCPLNSSSGKFEKVILKAIKGKDSFYTIEKSFRFDPTGDNLNKWMDYLRTVIVCDSRNSNHPCPKITEAVPSVDGEIFKKKFVGKPPNGDKLLEFVRENESFDNWTKLVGYRYQ